jgi:hypothetical protein
VTLPKLHGSVVEWPAKELFDAHQLVLKAILHKYFVLFFI